MAIKRKHINET